MTSKTATIHLMSLAGNNKYVLAHYGQSHGYDQISHALSNIHDLYGCSCNLFDGISIVYSLNLGKLPGRFSYNRPGYEASSLPALHAVVSYPGCLVEKNSLASFVSSPNIMSQMLPYNHEYWLHMMLRPASLVKPPHLSMHHLQ